MDENISKMLDEVIEAQISGLGSMTFGSSEREKAVSDLAELYRLKIEEVKGDREYEEKLRRLENEEVDQSRERDLKYAQLAEQAKERYFKYGLAAAETLATLLFYGRWMKKGFKFEETGTFTSATFKGLINRFRPTKR